MSIATLPIQAPAEPAGTDRADRPLVTIIMPVYNAGEYLRPALQSVLAQTYENVELLVVDDGSTDGAVEKIRHHPDPRVHVLKQPNQGRAAALNLALSRMRGEFYTTSDADDLSHPRRIELQVRYMLTHPDLAACFCGHELILDGRRLAPTFPRRDAKRCRELIDIFRMPGHDPTAMYRVKMIGEMRYDTSLRLCAAYDFILRIGERFPMNVMDECLYSYRIHPQAATRKDPSLRLASVVQVRRNACERRGWRYEDHPCPIPPDAEKLRHEQDNNLAAHFMQSVCDLRTHGRRWQAIRTGMQCVHLHPITLHYYKALIYALVPLRLLRLRRGEI
jgi:glycosyltransferase involved in cell wall biosynthesis